MSIWFIMFVIISIVGAVGLWLTRKPAKQN